MGNIYLMHRASSIGIYDTSGEGREDMTKIPYQNDRHPINLPWPGVDH